MRLPKLVLTMTMLATCASVPALADDDRWRRGDAGHDGLQRVHGKHGKHHDKHWRHKGGHHRKHHGHGHSGHRHHYDGRVRGYHYVHRPGMIQLYDRHHHLHTSIPLGHDTRWEIIDGDIYVYGRGTVSVYGGPHYHRVRSYSRHHRHDHDYEPSVFFGIRF